MAQAPDPHFVLRTHSAAVTCLFISPCNERIYSGDASGLVACTSTRTFRAVAVWNAHTDGLLGVEEWDEHVVTHGRDNKVHIWSSVIVPATVGDSVPSSFLTTPKLLKSLDVNALNYCRFSLLPLPRKGSLEGDAFLAVPNLVESSYVDIWSLSSLDRIHAAVGKTRSSKSSMGDGRGGPNTGILMSSHLFTDSKSPSESRLSLLCAYEDGSVTLWTHSRQDGGPKRTVEGRYWDISWSAKLHQESVMGLSVSRDAQLAITVSADHILGKYNLSETQASSTSTNPERFVQHRTKHPGNAAVTMRDDGRVCAVAGWDGKIRLYSTKTFKPLGILVFHKETCQAVIFARAYIPLAEGKSDPDEEMTEEEKVRRGRWLISGEKNGRVAIWELGTFGRDKG
ncbi:hypothetical protein BOTBODRAFT_27843 [Botryobasidium botryosum FD-172 SS1]|uniref:ASTRA-associated protein 1 n=1 Tax=Botryobasidium botryosum (strain FD-172 SS1) TaxID=930990 RepID=A0A067MX44_BOTB1|nr:hypothetical protein BOTBODRAFT_27843 [Botryobasidium botryosum FD-172 SS1]